MLIHMSVLQIRPTPIIPGLLNPVRLLFARPASDMQPKLSRPPMSCDNDDINLTVLINRLPQLNEDIDIHETFSFIPTGSPVAV